jgi:hypothetical protein
MAVEFLMNLASYRRVVVNYKHFFTSLRLKPLDLPKHTLGAEQVWGEYEGYTVPR